MRSTALATQLHTDARSAADAAEGAQAGVLGGRSRKSQMNDRGFLRKSKLTADFRGNARIAPRVGEMPARRKKKS